MDDQKKDEIRAMIVNMHGLIKRHKHTVGKLLKVCEQVLDDCDIANPHRLWPEELAAKRKRLIELRAALRVNLPLFEDDPPEVLVAVVDAAAAPTDLQGFRGDSSHD